MCAQKSKWIGLLFLILPVFSASAQTQSLSESEVRRYFDEIFISKMIGGHLTREEEFLSDRVDGFLERIRKSTSAGETLSSEDQKLKTIVDEILKPVRTNGVQSLFWRQSRLFSVTGKSMVETFGTYSNIPSSQIEQALRMTVGLTFSGDGVGNAVHVGANLLMTNRHVIYESSELSSYRRKTGLKITFLDPTTHDPKFQQQVAAEYNVESENPLEDLVVIRIRTSSNTPLSEAPSVEINFSGPILREKLLRPAYALGLMPDSKKQFFLMTGTLREVLFGDIFSSELFSEPGSSGAPVFAVRGGKLVLVGVTVANSGFVQFPGIIGVDALVHPLLDEEQIKVFRNITNQETTYFQSLSRLAKLAAPGGIDLSQGKMIYRSDYNQFFLSSIRDYFKSPLTFRNDAGTRWKNRPPDGMAYLYNALLKSHLDKQLSAEAKVEAFTEAFATGSRPIIEEALWALADLPFLWMTKVVKEIEEKLSLEGKIGPFVQELWRSKDQNGMIALPIRDWVYGGMDSPSTLQLTLEPDEHAKIILRADFPNQLEAMIRRYEEGGSIQADPEFWSRPKIFAPRPASIQLQVNGVRAGEVQKVLNASVAIYGKEFIGNGVLIGSDLLVTDAHVVKKIAAIPKRSSLIRSPVGLNLVHSPVGDPSNVTEQTRNFYENVAYEIVFSDPASEFAMIRFHLMDGKKIAVDPVSISFAEITEGSRLVIPSFVPVETGSKFQNVLSVGSGSVTGRTENILFANHATVQGGSGSGVYAVNEEGVLFLVGLVLSGNEASYRIDGKFFNDATPLKPQKTLITPTAYLNFLTDADPTLFRKGEIKFNPEQSFWGTNKVLKNLLGNAKFSELPVRWGSQPMDALTTLLSSLIDNETVSQDHKINSLQKVLSDRRLAVVMAGLQSLSASQNGESLARQLEKQTQAFSVVSMVNEMIEARNEKRAPSIGTEIAETGVVLRLLQKGETDLNLGRGPYILELRSAKGGNRIIHAEIPLDLGKRSLWRLERLYSAGREAAEVLRKYLVIGKKRGPIAKAVSGQVEFVLSDILVTAAEIARQTGKPYPDALVEALQRAESAEYLLSTGGFVLTSTAVSVAAQITKILSRAAGPLGLGAGIPVHRAMSAAFQQAAMEEKWADLEIKQNVAYDLLDQTPAMLLSPETERRRVASASDPSVLGSSESLKRIFDQKQALKRMSWGKSFEEAMADTSLADVGVSVAVLTVSGIVGHAALPVPVGGTLLTAILAFEAETKYREFRSDSEAVSDRLSHWKERRKETLSDRWRKVGFDVLRASLVMDDLKYPIQEETKFWRDLETEAQEAAMVGFQRSLVGFLDEVRNLMAASEYLRLLSPQEKAEILNRLPGDRSLFPGQRASLAAERRKRLEEISQWTPEEIAKEAFNVLLRAKGISVLRPSGEKSPFDAEQLLLARRLVKSAAFIRGLVPEAREWLREKDGASVQLEKLLENSPQNLSPEITLRRIVQWTLQDWEESVLRASTQAALVEKTLHSLVWDGAGSGLFVHQMMKNSEELVQQWRREN